MTLFNLHTHTSFSDGSDIPEKYLEEAIKQGFSVLGFSDHSPVPFKNNFALKEEELDAYFRSVLSLKNTSPVKVLAGIEMDFIPGVARSAEYYRNNYPVDYIIGSVHLVKNPDNDKLWFIDGPELKVYDNGLRDLFGGDARKAVTCYYQQVRDMILIEKPDIIGHFDKVKMNNRGRFFSEDEKWYRDLVEEALLAAKETGSVIEINTRGLYKKRSDTFFPGLFILQRIKLLDIPVIISSDAHKPHELSLMFEEAEKIVKETGLELVRY